jgi:hypothetical protein
MQWEGANVGGFDLSVGGVFHVGVRECSDLIIAFA